MTQASHVKELQDEVARLRHELSRRSAAGSPTSSARGTTVVSSKSKDPSDSSEEEDEHPPVDDDEVRPLSLNRFCAWCQDKGEKITKDKQGRFYRNGKLMSESAIEQRLRRFTATKKSGRVKSGEDVQNMFKDLDQRPRLMEMFKEANLNKAGYISLQKRSLHFIWFNTLVCPGRRSSSVLSR